MTTESNQASGGSVGSDRGEPLRLALGDQTYEVPRERVGHLRAALVVADQTCTASGRTVHNKPPEGVTGSDASGPHYLAADVAGDIAHWIAGATGVAALSGHDGAAALPITRDLLTDDLEHISDEGRALVEHLAWNGRLADIERLVREDLQAGTIQPYAAQTILEAAYVPATARLTDPEPAAEILAERFVDTWGRAGVTC